MKFQIDINNFLKTPQVVLFGMLGVFIALLVIYGAIFVLTKLFNNKKESEVPVLNKSSYNTNVDKLGRGGRIQSENST